MDQRLPDPAVAAPVDWRGLCEELYRAFTAHARTDTQHDLLDRARAALSQPEPEVVGPTDEELPPRVGHILRLAEIIREVDGNHSLGAAALAEAILSHPGSRWGRPAPAPAGEVAGPTDEEWDALVNRLWDQYETVGYQGERFMYEGDFSTALDLVRQKIARWGRPAPVPAEGEVGELVARLRYAKQNGNNIPSKVHWDLTDGTTHYASIYVGSDHADDCARAADLLERQAVTEESSAAAPVPVLPEGVQVIEAAKRTILVPVPVPVAVSERLPRPEDCDAEGQCWAWDYLAERWGLWPHESIADGFYHWLPAHALPLPIGEVE